MHKTLYYVIYSCLTLSLFSTMLLGATIDSPQKPLAKSGAGTEYDGIILKTKPLEKADDPKVSLTVHEDQIIQPVPQSLFGFNHNWLWSNRWVMEDSDAQNPVISPDFLKTLAGLPMPLNRMSGSMSQTYHWKMAMG
ncbi:MAG: hypothetical protein JKX85_13885, partial [Phycisphaeraceae bacterium]|nr:hypothetical protein [Phycisphaeraceae bacterium]